jgi:hypothetical protein
MKGANFAPDHIFITGRGFKRSLGMKGKRRRSDAVSSDESDEKPPPKPSHGKTQIPDHSRHRRDGKNPPPFSPGAKTGPVGTGRAAKSRIPTIVNDDIEYTRQSKVRPPPFRPKQVREPVINDSDEKSDDELGERPEWTVSPAPKQPGLDPVAVLRKKYGIAGLVLTVINMTPPVVDS